MFECLLFILNLSKSKIRGFYYLFGTVMFFEKNTLLSDELKEIRHEFAYLSKLFAKFCEKNCSCKEIRPILLRPNLSSLYGFPKLILFKCNIGCINF